MTKGILAENPTKPHLMSIMNLVFACISLAAICCAHALAGESIIKDSQDMDCFVYVPDPIIPGTTYQLVIGVHGAGGKGNGAAGMKNWAERGDVIVIGPSFVSKGERPYQNGDGVHAEKLIDLFETLKKSYKLRDTMFLHGFSGGSQFVHRFTMRHPKLVCGVSSHSGGTWATDNFGEINPSAKTIPFAISCGENDNAKSFPESPFTRLEWYGRYRGEIDKKGFCYIGNTWPGVGHSMSAGAWDLARQCFQLATGLPGQSATENVPISDQWKNLDAKQKKTSRPAITAQTPNVPSVNEAEVDKMAQAAFKKVDTEKIPDEQIIGFMKKYPPVLWKEKPGSAKLLEQCERAANAWYAAAKTNNKWTGPVKKEFARFTEGLKIKTVD